MAIITSNRTIFGYEASVVTSCASVRLIFHDLMHYFERLSTSADGRSMLLENWSNHGGQVVNQTPPGGCIGQRLHT
jgi:hypothetical protein